MSVVTADARAVDVGRSRNAGWLFAARCGLLGAIVVGATAFAAPRAAQVRHGEGVVVLGALLAIALAVRSWRGVATEPRAIPVRAADLSIAGGLGCAAVFLAWQMPVVFGADADSWGASLATVAPVVGAAIAVLFGSRMLYRLRGAVTSLALLSPALLRPVYVVFDAATKLAARAVVETAAAIDHSLLSPGGSAQAAGDLLAQRLTTAGALEAAAVLILLGWRLATGRRSAHFAWSAFVVVVCFGAALRNAVPAACVAAVLATPAFRLRFAPREHQREPLRCLPRGEPVLLAASAILLAGLGIAATGLPQATTPLPSRSFVDAVATLPGAIVGPADPREVALAGASAQWRHWTLPNTGHGLPPAASLTLDHVTSSNGFDGDVLSAAMRAGGYRLLSTKRVADGVLRSFTGPGGDGLTLLAWTPDGAPGQLAVVTVYQPDGVSAAASAAAEAVAAQLARGTP